MKLVCVRLRLKWRTQCTNCFTPFTGGEYCISGMSTKLLYGWIVTHDSSTFHLMAIVPSTLNTLASLDTQRLHAVPVDAYLRGAPTRSTPFGEEVSCVTPGTLPYPWNGAAGSDSGETVFAVFSSTFSSQGHQYFPTVVRC